MAQVTIQHQEPLQLTGKKTYVSEDLQAVSDSVNCERKCLGYKEEKPKHGNTISAASVCCMPVIWLLSVYFLYPMLCSKSTVTRSRNLTAEVK